eukprot:TRINITY_DN1126_c0_g1_i2.p1 TRINITY_DN1126_c0_g1~~TRINITY_DN1126_c0_g1_i2.p1  ORF type:complete len:1373 (-),score=269.59 TRINITY_DN1126_c0_g1_i2:335-4453(-)
MEFLNYRSIAIDANANDVGSVALHTTAATVAIAIRQRVMLYDLHTSALLLEVKASAKIIDVAFFRSSQKLVGLGEDGFVYVWDCEKSQLINTFGPIERDHSAFGTNDLTLVYTRAGRSTITLLNLESGDSARLDVKGKAPSLFIMHPKQSVFASVSPEGSVRMVDMSQQVVLCGVDDIFFALDPKEARPSVTAAAFHPTLPWLLLGTSAGVVHIWAYSSGPNMHFVGKKLASQSSIGQLFFHPWISVCFMVTGAGTLSCWNISQDGDHMKPSGLFRMHALLDAPDVGRASRSASIAEAPLSVIRSWRFLFHNSHNLIVKFCRPSAAARDACVLQVLLVNDPNQAFPFGPFSASQYTGNHGADLSWKKIWAFENYTYEFPDRVFYIDGHDIVQQSLVLGAAPKSVVSIKTLTGENNAARVLGLRGWVEGASLSSLTFAVLGQYDESQSLSNRSSKVYKRNTFVAICRNGSEPSIIKKDGIDCCFLGRQGTHFAILRPDGRELEIYNTKTFWDDNAPVHTISLQVPVSSMHWAPYCQGSALLFRSSSFAEAKIYGCAGFSPTASASSDFRHLEMNTNISIDMQVDEQIVQVEWAPVDLRDAGACVLTTQRMIVLKGDLSISYRVHAPNTHFFTSCMWISDVLVCTNASQIVAYFHDGSSMTLGTLDSAELALCAAFNDRVFTLTRVRNRAVLRHHPIGLLEPFARALLTRPSLARDAMRKQLEKLFSRYDGMRISNSLHQLLARKGLMDIARGMSVNSTSVPRLQKFEYSFSCKEYSEALSALNAEHARTKEYPKIDTKSALCGLFRKLAAKCVEEGQFDIAKKCYETIQDNLALASLSVSCDPAKARGMISNGMADLKSAPFKAPRFTAILRSVLDSSNPRTMEGFANHIISNETKIVDALLHLNATNPLPDLFENLYRVFDAHGQTTKLLQLAFAYDVRLSDNTSLQLPEKSALVDLLRTIARVRTDLNPNLALRIPLVLSKYAKDLDSVDLKGSENEPFDFKAMMTQIIVVTDVISEIIEALPATIRGLLVILRNAIAERYRLFVRERVVDALNMITYRALIQPVLSNPSEMESHIGPITSRIASGLGLVADVLGRTVTGKPYQQDKHSEIDNVMKMSANNLQYGMDNALKGDMSRMDVFPFVQTKVQRESSLKGLARVCELSIKNLSTVLSLPTESTVKKPATKEQDTPINLFPRSRAAFKSSTSGDASTPVDFMNIDIKLRTIAGEIKKIETIKLTTLEDWLTNISFNKIEGKVKEKKESGSQQGAGAKPRVDQDGYLLDEEGYRIGKAPTAGGEKKDSDSSDDEQGAGPTMTRNKDDSSDEDESVKKPKKIGITIRPKEPSSTAAFAFPTLPLAQPGSLPKPPGAEDR